MPIVLRFIEPCLPSPADRPPSGSNWIHEIKHDGYRLMARRDPVGIRLITRRGNDWTIRFPLVVEAVNRLKVRSCLIDGEVVCCDQRGLATFQLLRHRRNEPKLSSTLLHHRGQTLGGRQDAWGPSSDGLNSFPTPLCPSQGRST
jgi:ATP-dependent DNA ligase